MEGYRQLRTKKRKRARLISFVQVGILLLSIITLAAAGFIYSVLPDTDISQLKNQIGHSTKIYDQNKELASTVTANKSEGVSIEKIPEHVKNAVIAIEDRRFYEHHGIDYKGITRAMVNNLKAGGIVEGGSTLTQQFIKISLLESDRTYKRKIQEYFLAKEVEHEYKKEEILEMYLNQIYFGHGAWGINKASKIYFGKDVEKLTISEGAMLAGVINLPSKLDPYKNYEGAINRRNLVLSRMDDLKLISAEEAEQAKKEPITLASIDQVDPLKGKYPYYVDHVLAEASKMYKLDLDELLTGGYKIYTTLDQEVQSIAEAIYKEDSNFPTGTSSDLVQSGTILIDPKTGGIKALIGGRGTHQFLGYNRATQLITSPGSSIKPLAVYVPALKEGYELTDPLVDEKMAFGTYNPENLNGQYKGTVPMYEAVMESLNVPTVWLLNEIGIQKGVDSLKDFGLPLEKDDRNLSIALGGMSKGVSPQDMAEAYTVFANSGVRNESHAIVKIEDPNGKEIAVWEEQSKKVATKEVVAKMNSMLLGVVKYGTGVNAAVYGHEIAGKTGSTQVPIEGISGVKDQWFVGYTPSLVGAVWVGYDKTDKDHYLTTYSSEGATKIFQKIMAQSLQYQESKSFKADDIGPLIEEQERKTEEENQKNFWEDKKEEFKRGWNNWRNKLFNSDGN